MRKRHLARLEGSILDKYRVKLMARALRDLDSIYAYIAKTFLEPGTAFNSLLFIKSWFTQADIGVKIAQIKQEGFI